LRRRPLVKPPRLFDPSQGCARLSLACLVDESSTMLITRSTCSKSGGGVGNHSRRSPGARILEPQRKRIRFSPVIGYLVVVNPSLRAKPVIRLEGMSMCTNGATRGDWEQREKKDKSRNLGGPLGRFKCQLLSRMHKALGVQAEVGYTHISEEAGNDRGAKGCNCRLAKIETRSSA